MARYFTLILAFVVSGFFSLSLLPISKAKAQERLKMSTSEDVAMLFYKAGNSVPNFSKWVEDTPEYAHTPWARREQKMAQEKNEFMRRYQEIDPKNNLIRVKVLVDMVLHEVKEGDKTSHVLSLKFSGADKVDYFPYPFLDQHIAVIPTNLKDFRYNRISKDKYLFLKTLLDKRSSNSFPAVLEMLGEKADITQPYDLDGIYQWIFRSKIAVFSVYNDDGLALWDKMESWYTSPITENLNELYNGQYKEEPEYIGGVTP